MARGLRPHQPDVRVAHPQKLEAISRVVETLRDAGYSFVTMREAAAELALVLGVRQLESSMPSGEGAATTGSHGRNRRAQVMFVTAVLVPLRRR